MEAQRGAPDIDRSLKSALTVIDRKCKGKTIRKVIIGGLNLPYNCGHYSTLNQSKSA
jgi:hypothetical protein